MLVRMPTFDRFPLLGLRLEELGEELERSFLSTNSPPLGLSSWSRNLLAQARAGHEHLREVFKLLPIPFPSLSLTPIKYRISYFPLPFLSKRSPNWVEREGISWPSNWGRFRIPNPTQTTYLNALNTLF